MSTAVAIRGILQGATASVLDESVQRTFFVTLDQSTSGLLSQSIGKRSFKGVSDHLSEALPIAGIRNLELAAIFPCF